LKRSRLRRHRPFRSRSWLRARHPLRQRGKGGPIPKPAVIVYPDGRECCNLRTAEGQREYHIRKAKVWARDKGLCCLCDLFLKLDHATTEHKIPRSRGRDDRLSNLGVSHYWGNMKKGSVTLDAYRAKYSAAERSRFCKGE
jgi:hypothetical protein